MTGGDKFVLYREIPSLREYLLVSQRRVLVELFSREEDNRWTRTEFNSLADQVPLGSVGCSLALSKVYDKVELVSPWNGHNI